MSLYKIIDDISERKSLRDSFGSTVMNGVSVGVVTKNSDDEHKGMVCVKLLSREEQGNVLLWVRVAMPMTGQNWGCYLLPEVGDQVLVAFADGKLDSPFVIGSIPKSDSRLVSDCYDQQNQQKAIVTKGGNALYFHDEKGKERVRLTTKGGHYIEADDAEDRITLCSKDGKTKAELSTKSSSIELRCDSKITLSAGSVTIEINGKSGAVTVKCSQLNLEAKQGIKMKTANFTLKASTLNAKASGGVFIKSESVASVKGQTVLLG